VAGLLQRTKKTKVLSFLLFLSFLFPLIVVSDEINQQSTLSIGGFMAEGTKRKPYESKTSSVEVDRSASGKQALSMVEREPGPPVAYKSVTFSLGSVGDCTWLDETIIMYENGNYSDIASLSDGGTFEGDAFNTRVFVWAGNLQVATWNWREWVDAGERDNHEAKGHSDGIAQHFDRIDRVERTIQCGD
jgi:hypothetical protein